MKETPPSPTPSHKDQLCRVGSSVELTNMIEIIPQPTPTKIEATTQTQPIQQQAPFDVQEDKRQNKWSSFNINRNANSNDDQPNPQDQQDSAETIEDSIVMPQTPDNTLVDKPN